MFADTVVILGLDQIKNLCLQILHIIKRSEAVRKYFLSRCIFNVYRQLMNSYQIICKHISDPDKWFFFIKYLGLLKCKLTTEGTTVAIFFIMNDVTTQKRDVSG